MLISPSGIQHLLYSFHNTVEKPATVYLSQIHVSVLCFGKYINMRYLCIHVWLPWLQEGVSLIPEHPGREPAENQLPGVHHTAHTRYVENMADLIHIQNHLYDILYSYLMCLCGIVHVKL